MFSYIQKNCQSEPNSQLHQEMIQNQVALSNLVATLGYVNLGVFYR